MKRIIFILLVLLPLFSQGQTLLRRYGTFTTLDSGSRVVDKYLAIPGISTTPSGTSGFGYDRRGGLIAFDSVGNGLYCFNGTSWIKINSATGTVTSVGATVNNGITVSGSPITTSGSFTFGLGAITPTSVAASSTVTGSNLSGTNTGDQTTITGNAGTATTLQTGRTIAITGDIAYTSPSFNGSSNVTATGTLATVNSNIGTFNNITVNGKGLVTAASNVTYLTGTTGWTTSGNAGVTSGFLGTTDANNLLLKANNTTLLQLNSAGTVRSLLGTGLNLGDFYLSNTNNYLEVKATNGTSSIISLNQSGILIDAERNANVHDTESTIEMYPDFIRIIPPLYSRAFLISGLKGNNQYDSIAVFSGDTLKKTARFSGTPTVSLGAGAGTGATYSCTACTNEAGIIVINTGTLPTLSSTVVTITFSSPFAFSNGTIPITAAHNPNTAVLSGAQMIYAQGNITNWVITAGITALTASTTYEWNYIVKDY